LGEKKKSRSTTNRFGQITKLLQGVGTSGTAWGKGENKRGAPRLKALRLEGIWKSEPHQRRRGESANTLSRHFSRQLEKRNRKLAERETKREGHRQGGLQGGERRWEKRGGGGQKNFRKLSHALQTGTANEGNSPS